MMTEEEFFLAWKRTCEKDKIQDSLLSRWNSVKADYSDVIFLGVDENKSVLDELCKELQVEKLHFCPEYYHCDAAFYIEDTRLKTNPFSKPKNTRGLNSTWLKQILVHFEHENNIDDSWEEIIQLQNIPGELNVLVTYPEENTEEDRNKKLEVYYNEIANKDLKFLIIFGQKKSNTKIEWFGYKLEKYKFVEVK